ncbi:MAG TPA: hemerythrin domain-containing protein [Candidatus Omnitrophota bacterium]|nr:hemerythrin domain-containing protein [Candidatus Omnitrophota bacterium]
MLPIGPLMIEHRLIERMIELLKKELQRIEKNRETDHLFIEKAVDFLRMYADRCHHGKEEDILFKELLKKKLKVEDKKMVDDLIAGHVYARNLVKDLVNSKVKYVSGEKKALDIIEKTIGALVNFYPDHIEKEDKHFFLPVMGYFSDKEKNDMLDKFWEFDRKLIHEKYENVVKNLEKLRNIDRQALSDKM